MLSENDCLELGRKLSNKYIRENIDIDLSMYRGDSLVEKLYNYFHPESHTCLQCSKPTQFRSFSKGYRLFCSKKCLSISDDRKQKSKQTCLEKYGREYPVDVQKSKQTCLERYGVEHAAQSNQIKEKTKQTCLERYGVVAPMASEKIREKSKQTCLERYGVEYITQTQEMVKKTKQTKQDRYGDPNYTNRTRAKQTCLERYGVEHYSQTKMAKKQFKQTCLERYGVEHPMRNEQVKQKLRQTCLEHYGVTCSLHNPEVWQHTIDTCLERYGVRNPMQTKEIQNKVIDSNINKYGVPYGFLNTEPGYSKSSQEYFDSLKAEHPNAVYATNGGEYKVGPYLLDWYDPDTNTAIEFNGDYWHANPAFYEPNWIHPVKKCPAKEIWMKDIEKMEYLMEQGIDVKVVWESDIKRL